MPLADCTGRCSGHYVLSGGQSGKLASARLNAMNAGFQPQLPWALSFSFARAIQQPALEIWRAKKNVFWPPSKPFIIGPYATEPRAMANIM